MVYIIFCKINNVVEEHIKMGGRVYIGDENIRNKLQKNFLLIVFWQNILLIHFY